MYHIVKEYTVYSQSVNVFVWKSRKQVRAKYTPEVAALFAKLQALRAQI